MSNNGSGFTSSNPDAPEGSQVGVVQTDGSISQSFTLTGGSYTLSLEAAQRGNYQSSYQQVEVTLSTQASITSTKNFIWIGNTIAEERDENNTVTRRFYPQGEQISGANCYYTRDHLGSIRELVDSTQTVRARYDYDPYGNRTKLSGDLDAEFGYTGHYFHQHSNLYLTLYRGYDPTVGRWLSRDPIGEEGGLNLFQYGANDPLRFRDPLGLAIVVNNTGVPIVVSGNIGAGHGGEGAQAFGIILPGHTGGGKDNPILAYPTREDAINGTNPSSGSFSDVDFYDSLRVKDHSPRQCDNKVIGDDQGPVIRLSLDPSGEIISHTDLLTLPGAYRRRILEKLGF